jgi:hypothetical protein
MEHLGCSGEGRNSCKSLHKLSADAVQFVNKMRVSGHILS